ncbi:MULTISPECIES: superoxide dismutase family protein [Edaphosphingomonas]|nr:MULTISPECIES: superoxide dismutase family protein [Sphingomonas]AGH48243.1 Cu/Zn superoxide dismutase [Sphingomonas sp. MM-1]OHT20715.1 Superoxide dismutase-like protein YojM precursor [Sphingomonas haloaromaticamans]
MRYLTILPLAMAGMLGACATSGAGGGAEPPAPAATTASVALAGPDGASLGSATLTQLDGGVRVAVEGQGLPPGAHGLHLHMVGLCEGPGFVSAGTHWNPTHMVHGKDAQGGPHWGDLPNLIVGTDGAGRVEATIPGARLTGGDNPLIDADGAALVVHASPDDYRTDPTGNSGGRIACGVVVPN